MPESSISAQGPLPVTQAQINYYTSVVSRLKKANTKGKGDIYAELRANQHLNAFANWKHFSHKDAMSSATSSNRLRKIETLNGEEDVQKIVQQISEYFKAHKSLRLSKGGLNSLFMVSALHVTLGAINLMSGTYSKAAINAGSLIVIGGFGYANTISAQDLQHSIQRIESFLIKTIGKESVLKLRKINPNESYFYRNVADAISTGKIIKRSEAEKIALRLQNPATEKTAISDMYASLFEAMA